MFGSNIYFGYYFQVFVVLRFALPLKWSQLFKFSPALPLKRSQLFKFSPPGFLLRLQLIVRRKGQRHFFTEALVCAHFIFHILIF